MNTSPGPRKFKYSPAQLERLWWRCIRLDQRRLSRNLPFNQEELRALSHLLSILRYRVGWLQQVIDSNSTIEKPAA